MRFFLRFSQVAKAALSSLRYSNLGRSLSGSIDASRAETLRILGRYASNSELSFSWYDAAVLSQKIRQEDQKSRSQRRFEMPLPSDVDDARGDAE